MWHWSLCNCHCYLHSTCTQDVLHCKALFLLLLQAAFFVSINLRVAPEYEPAVTWALMHSQKFEDCSLMLSGLTVGEMLLLTNTWWTGATSSACIFCLVGTYSTVTGKSTLKNASLQRTSAEKRSCCKQKHCLIFISLIRSFLFSLWYPLFIGKTVCLPLTTALTTAWWQMFVLIPLSDLMILQRTLLWLAKYHFTGRCCLMTICAIPQFARDPFLLSIFCSSSSE